MAQSKPPDSAPIPPPHASAYDPSKSWEERLSAPPESPPGTSAPPVAPAAISAKTQKRSLREKLNQHRWVTILLALLVTALAIYFSLKPAPGPQGFYTTDDGKTFFTDDYQVPPYTKGGKEAVQAVVFTCNGRDPFVGYMIRYSDEGKQALQERMKGENARELRRPHLDQYLVKRPGENEPWVPAPGTVPGLSSGQTDEKVAKFNDITSHVKCPGGDGTPTQIFP